MEVDGDEWRGFGKLVASCEAGQWPLTVTDKLFDEEYQAVEAQKDGDPLDWRSAVFGRQGLGGLTKVTVQYECVSVMSKWR